MFKDSFNEEIRRELLITLHETPGIGWHTIQKAAAFGAWSSYQRFTEEAWCSSVGLKPEQAKKVTAAFRQMDAAARSARMEQLGVKVLTSFDSGYPELLAQTPQPPWVLYMIGRIELLYRPTMAIVGTRGPTAYGRRAAADMASQLSERGLTVVSGLARGIDSIAHEGALPLAGGTIAVLGTPADKIYPAENRSLYREIGYGGNGLIVSEVPFGTPFHRGLFPLRNRIIAGLSLGTIVIEAAERSGSLITADQAFDMSREVFAIPGPISSPKSEGTNKLIRTGTAKLVSTVAHVLEEYEGRLDLPLHGSADDRSRKMSGSSALTDHEAFICRLLQEKPLSTDELHVLTSFPFGLLHATLINLTLKHMIEQHPGSIYSVR
ncbi:DNA-processing protein DprA [Paenibacillus nasutitermitis]|uniref:DNA processing protein DprA n=1 Tax=Paenibacillus nasutitermitis TaxID=1652958 RepID=A0A916YZI6_9BACL|nr:DNA-processing protein DprA [Paenibacillus nasutitermitis]GGD68489.1 DNA processing protein DprA [Paenibacillus nasutitermitis]